MFKHAEINYEELDENKKFEELINNVVEKCFEVENLANSKLYVNIILTIPEVIKRVNKQYRNIDNPTDVLSFPMFEKNEIYEMNEEEVLGDIMISIPKVEEQAIEYGHSFDRELAYMVVHGFYHLMGEDHIEEKDKIRMREKEENVLSKLQICR